MSRRRLISTVLAVVSVLGGVASAAHAESLAQLEIAARANAPAVGLAQEDAQLQRHRLDAAEAQRGARFIAGVGLADTREPLTSATTRDYRRGSAQVGVRWPLFEGAQALERAQTDARGALAAARLRARQAETDVLRELRLAYVDHLRSAERLAFAEALLAFEPGMTDMLAARTRQSFLLETDRRELQSIFEFARRDAERARAQRDEARRRMRRMSALPQAEPALSAPRWDLGCATPAPLLAGADERPAFTLASIELATREAVAGQQQWNGIDAGVSLTQSLAHDLGAASGRSTGISFDVSVPFGWRALRDARTAEAQTAVRRARIELDTAREADAAAMDQAFRELRVREADRRAALQHLAAAQEALRVAELRARKLDGDVLERVLVARRGLYAAALDVTEALQRLERAQASALDYAAPCGENIAALEPPQWHELPATLARPIATSASAAGLGWFAWQGAPWLSAPADHLAGLPLGTQRVLLGFDAKQLGMLATPAGAQALRGLVVNAHERGVHIELLLGDPDWVLPAGRARLLELLRPIATLPFDGLVLDLERNQLATQARHRWAGGVIATVAAVRDVLRWPIALTAHDRDLLDAAFNRRVQAAGVAELIAMVYVANRERAAQRVQAVLRAAGRQRVSVAQSIERELPASSSLHRLGQAAALRHFDALARDTASAAPDESHFGGVVIQSLEEFRAAPP